MIVSPCRLLPSTHACCIYLLLLLVIACLIASSASSPSSSTRPASEPQEAADQKSSTADSTDKCQFNLTDTDQSLEVRSSSFQRLGFDRCQFLLQAPGPGVLLLNFTDLHLQPDMSLSLELGHSTQALATTTTTAVTTTTTTTPPPQASSSSSSSSPPSLPLTEVKTAQAKKNSYLGKFSLDHIAASGSGNLGEQRGDTEILTNTSSPSTSREYPSGDSNPSFVGGAGLPDSQRQVVGGSDLDRSQPGHVNSRGEQKRDPLKEGSQAIESLKRGKALDHSGVTTAKTNTDEESDLLGCSLKLIIEVTSSPETSPEVICWKAASSRPRLPLVFRYNQQPVRITYLWGRRHSGFSLDFKFLPATEPETVCYFRCSKFQCLAKEQLCDGISDCADHSDEHSNTCTLVRQSQDTGDSAVIQVVVILTYVVSALVLVLVIAYVICHFRCRSMARRCRAALLQPPHSHSSEVFQSQSPSSSLQESGQYEALLPERAPLAQSPALRPPVVTPSSHGPHLQQREGVQHLRKEADQLPGKHGRAGQEICLRQHVLPLPSLAVGQPPDDRVETSGAAAAHPPHRHQQRHSLRQVQPHLPRQPPAAPAVSTSELYPPPIALSADGEEGYAMSQRALRQQLPRDWQADTQLIRPPPNKTVFDRDSPQPPYSISAPGRGQMLDSHFSSVGVVCGLRLVQSLPTSYSSPPPGIPRCHSLSCHR